MLLWAIDNDIAGGFAKIQKRVEDEHAQNQVLSGECDPIALRVKTLEAQVVGLEAERASLRTDVETLRGARAILEEEVQTE